MSKQTKRFPFLKIQRQRFELSYINNSSTAEIPSEKQCYQWIWHALKNYYRHANIALVFFNETEAQAYNREFRDKDYATNVLSFAHHEGEFYHAEQKHTLQGDLIICPQIVEREAAEQDKPLMNHYAHLIIHGTLHLIGFDHIENDEAEEMEALETALLAQLNIPNPYE